jgi:hypothetical protein
MKILKFIIAGLLIATPLSAQNGGNRLIELPAHKRLESIRSDGNATLNLFETDGCSGFQSQSWEFIATKIPAFERAHKKRPPWESCCVTHDIAYHIGGFNRDASASFLARIRADQKLRKCIIQTAKDRDTELSEIYGMKPTLVKSAYTTIANAMFLAVRLGGAPCSGLPWRWGYGYENCGLFD